MVVAQEGDDAALGVRVVEPDRARVRGVVRVVLDLPVVELVPAVG